MWVQGQKKRRGGTVGHPTTAAAAVAAQSSSEKTHKTDKNSNCALRVSERRKEGRKEGEPRRSQSVHRAKPGFPKL